ncbi:uncharacterized protein M421DRAFT_190501 [Didymella exigua CBS 183.55]|uniref:Uncharacterized protein n=1 Tax=Didymella exigua CBS 183.55 TaxID=1150837 RepID=A0A6A5S3U3_9PLEO|nr:uncharacterized protein M421DRAFT_190501 [Didymella exigua CBS 183.55]KAF1933136.1 hypothetical protein M421DRAFT_190501 [Didymella exigua CBS 183.55]
MRSFLRYTMLALPLLGGVVAEQPSTQMSDLSNSIYANAQEAFQDLLNALPEESLQAALNSLTKFKAGVFESHRRGVEHVHSSSPALATKLIVAAVQDLKKRQAPAPSNGTTPAPSSQAPAQPSSSAQPSLQQEPTSSQAPAASTRQQTSAAVPASTAASTPSSRPVVVAVDVTTTNSVGSTVIQTSEVLSEVTASVEVTVVRTTTNSVGSTVAVTTQEVRPAVIRTTTDSRGSSVVVTSAGNLAPTRGEVLTTTDAAGVTLLTTYTPGGGKVSSVKLVTTTDAAGQAQTLTTIIEVDPTDVAGNGAAESASSTPTATGRPSVQSGAARKNHAAVAGLAGLGAFAFFL